MLPVCRLRGRKPVNAPTKGGKVHQRNTWDNWAIKTGTKRHIVAIVVGSALLAACSGGGATKSKDASASPSATRATDGSSVTIRLVAFNPEKLEVTPGTKVTWTQTDKGSIHTVTSGIAETDSAGTVAVQADEKFDSGELTEDKPFSFTFPTAGTYPYFCSIHPATMRGQVVVR